jgi:hypothetical protein
MANGSGTAKVGNGQPKRPPRLVDVTEADEGDEAAAGPSEVGGQGSAWERMLEALSAQDGPEAPGLRASIAERLHTRRGSPELQGGPPVARPAPARRRRR